MPFQIIPGLYQITHGGNIFLLETAHDELTLIDTGIPGATKKVLNAVATLDKEPQQIKQILITHAEFDHVGSLAGLVKATGASVYASTESTPYIETARTPPHIAPILSFFTGSIQKLLQKPAKVDQRFSDGAILTFGTAIQAIAAPGHTPDNYGFYWREKEVLFAADLLNTISGTLGLTQAFMTWNMQVARQSARSILQLEPKIICVGHGQPVNLVKDPDAANILRQNLNQSASFATI